MLVCATRGEAGIPGLLPEVAGRLRERELREAAATLGLTEVRFLGYRDGQLTLADPERIICRLVDIMCEVRPQVVITFGPEGISGHPDHLAIHRYTTLAFDRAELSFQGKPARLFYLAPSEATLQGCGVVPSSQEGAEGSVVAVNVASYLTTKVRAMQCHASQKPPYPGPPEEEAKRLTCHEYFTLTRPASHQVDLTDLFEAVGSLREKRYL